MRSALVRACTLSCFVFLAGSAYTQGVYVAPGEHGPVFSDKPQPGSKEVTLKPLNVIPPTPTRRPDDASASAGPANRGGKRGAPVASPYQRFSIVAPVDEGSVLGDTSLFEVRLSVDPPLLVGEGHAFVVRINGRFVDQRFTSTEFVIPPDFWEDGYLPANSRMQIDVSIVDAVGQIVMRADPVVFYTRQRVFLPRPYHLGPASPVHRPPLRPRRPPARDDVPDEPPAPAPRKMK